MLGLVDPFLGILFAHPELSRSYVAILVTGRYPSTLFSELTNRLTADFRAVLPSCPGRLFPRSRRLPPAGAFPRSRLLGELSGDAAPLHRRAGALPGLVRHPTIRPSSVASEGRAGADSMVGMTDTVADVTPEIAPSSYDAAQRRSDAIWRKIESDPSGLRMLTGDRPTGALHIGHYFGSLRNRVRLQQAGVETWVIVADYQVITDREILGDIQGSVRELLTDYLAVGIDPERATIFTHSAVPALNQLMLPFLSLVTQPELERNPTVKAELAAAGKSAMGGLMLTYPVHQAADILFCHGNLVPVGKDQLPHIEQTRVIARRFNERYAGGEEYFPEPDALLSESPTILGLDGENKMSKSLGNTVMLRMDEAETLKKIKKAKTDADRQITYDPENRPEVANLLTIAAQSTGRTPEDIAEEIGDRGAGTLKIFTAEALNAHLAPLRARRAELEQDPGHLMQVLRTGNERANAAADETLQRVREFMGMVY